LIGIVQLIVILVDEADSTTIVGDGTISTEKNIILTLLNTI